MRPAHGKREQASLGGWHVREIVIGPVSGAATARAGWQLGQVCRPSRARSALA
ncbi:hypothetical protein [Comamonas fluminis]|uniref:hypothetical protein n=1 Tax=Comamonas fluminis TaxID=2796366 RepID=UPI001C491DA6|nr:hypothetical protein [Comamonas fluminis]